MIWFFGYGSLMWLPGFEFERKELARLSGYHRRYCMYSTKNRGTPEVPGMMLGLMPGGDCVGMAYQVRADQYEAALEYLDKREGEGKANRRVMAPVRILSETRPVFAHAWTYLPMVSYDNYAGVLPETELVEKLAIGKGLTGTAHEYLSHLIQELRTHRIDEPELEALYARVEQVMKNNGSRSGESD